ncbi:MAG: ferritin-like domain-containing protein, partial [Acidobacteriota bacterium]
TFTRLAVFEDRHLHHVHSLYEKETGEASDLASLLAATGPELEGGLPAAAFLEQLGGEPASAQEALELAASVEAQALDLYSRMAERAKDPEAKALYATLTQEEKSHLRAVAALLSRLPNA